MGTVLAARSIVIIQGEDLKKHILRARVWLARMRSKRGWLATQLRRGSGLFYVSAVICWVGFVWFAWAKWGAPAALRYLCSPKEECAYLGQVGDLFGGVNALFAGLAFAGLALTLEASRRQSEAQRQWDKDKELVDQIRLSYQWSYDSLSSFTNASADHQSVRRGWLVAARHLLRAQRLVSDVKTEVFKTIQQEHEEMWRSRMNILVSDTKDLPFQASVLRQTSIELRSALVVANFIVGGDDWKDPIDEIDEHALFESDSWRGSGLSRVIENFVIRGRPEFLQTHIERYPNGRVAAERDKYASGLQSLYSKAYPRPTQDPLQTGE